MYRSAPTQISAAQLLLTTLLVIFTLAAACSDDSDARPSTATSPPASPTPTPVVSDPRTVSLGAGSALVWGSGSYGVVLVHGAIYDAASWTNQAAALAGAGFAVVAVENATADDTLAALDYLRRTFGAEAAALVGASAGAGPVLTVATRQPPESRPSVDLVVVLAGSGDVADLDVPSVLFIAAADDGGAAAAATRMLEATSGDPADLLIVPGNAHAQALFNESEGAQVLSAIVKRLTERQATLGMEP